MKPLMCLLVAVAVGCGGAQAPPPCVETTWLIPEEHILQRVIHTYDDDGRVTASETIVGERETTVERVETTYDDRGRVADEVVHGVDEEDRPVELLVHYTYDEAGQLAAVDWLAGTEVQRGETYTYDEDGRVTEVVFYGPAPEGAVERVIRHTYGYDGRTETVETDLLGDGAVDSRLSTTYDDDGRPLVVESSGLDEAPFVRTTYVYDEGGRPLREESDAGADGTIETVRRYVYDEEQDALVSEEIDEGNDGTVDRRIEYAYDEDGRLVSETDLVRDRGDDPVASRRVTSSRTDYDYSCWE